MTKAPSAGAWVAFADYVVMVERVFNTLLEEGFYY
jgi:hypothetical protein